MVCFLFWSPILRSCAVPKRRKAPQQKHTKMFLRDVCLGKLGAVFRTKAKYCGNPRQICTFFILFSRPLWSAFCFEAQSYGAAPYQNGTKPPSKNIPKCFCVTFALANSGQFFAPKRNTAVIRIISICLIFSLPYSKRYTFYFISQTLVVCFFFTYFPSRAVCFSFLYILK